MRLQRLELRNFKAFHGDHTIVFPDRGDKRPVYLFGGLNGAGKTTLTQAFVTGLHGARAGGLPGLFAAGRDTRAHYARWLAAAFNRPAHKQGADEMSVSLTLADANTAVTVTRLWWFDAAGDYVEEQLEVREDHSGSGSGSGRSGSSADPDADSNAKATTQFVGDAAQALVDELLPRHLLDFAVFDGEQVRRLDDTLSSSAVRSALDRLLDLDAVERTRSELQRIIRDRRLDMADEGQRKAYESLKERFEDQRLARADAAAKLADTETAQTRMQRELDELAAQLDAILAGGAPGQLTADLANLRERRSGLRSRLGRHVGDWLYLSPAVDDMQGLIDSVRFLQERRHGRDRLKLELETVETLADRLIADPSLINTMGATASAALKDWFAQDTEVRHRDLDQATVEAEDGSLSQLTDAELTDVEAAAAATARDMTDVHELASDYLRVDARIRELEDLLQSADQGSASARVLRQRDELNVLLGQQVALADQQRTDLETQDAELASTRGHLHTIEARLAVDSDEVHWLETAESTVAALDEFLAESRAQASVAVQERMLRNLKLLLRKQSLVTDVVVDPTTHVTHLLGPDGNAVELPSAAEHQLAAMAFIDAVLAASDVPLPMFIDTPLARLDSHHRRAVVRDFWPSIGRQVIVLSTDEEVVGQVLNHARKSLAASYRIDCAPNGRSTITAGEYLADRAEERAQTSAGANAQAGAGASGPAGGEDRGGDRA